jgi:predicted lipid-binding transport protein (Tim44 family)
MRLACFGREAATEDIVAAMQRDGAAVVTELVAPEVMDEVAAELRARFDSYGRTTESRACSVTRQAPPSLSVTTR